MQRYTFSTTLFHAKLLTIHRQIAAGYFSGTRKVGQEDLDNTRGRGWEGQSHYTSASMTTMANQRLGVSNTDIDRA